MEAAQDLLPHRGAQLVRDVRHLHDPAQQWRAGTLLGVEGGQGGEERAQAEKGHLQLESQVRNRGRALC